MLPIWLLAAMMIMMYYWRFWEPCANSMLVVLLPKFWFGLEIMTGHNCFWMSSWGSPLLDPKKLQNQQFYKIDWIRKNSWSMLPIWLLVAMMIMMYYWKFWEPWANAMLVVLLPKLWKSWLAQLFLDVFLGLTLTGPKKASKSTILYNRLNKEQNSWIRNKTPSGKRLLPRCVFPVLGSKSSGLAELFSANARARWRKRCETKATTNIAFAQGSQTSNSTS